MTAATWFLLVFVLLALGFGLGWWLREQFP